MPLLVGLLGQQPVEEALLALLVDNDTGVTEEAAGALLRHASVAALTIFARGWVVADEDDTMAQMEDYLYLAEPYDTTGPRSCGRCVSWQSQWTTRFVKWQERSWPTPRSAPSTQRSTGDGGA